MFRFLCRMVNNEDDANDLAQETLSGFSKPAPHSMRTRNFPRGCSPLRRIWREIKSAGARGIPMFRWMKNRIRQSNHSGKSSSSALTPKEQGVVRRTRVAVRAAVNALPEDLREAIVLCEWEEHSMAEAAEVLEATPKAIESRLYRARQILREKLKGWLA